MIALEAPVEQVKKRHVLLIMSALHFIGKVDRPEQTISSSRL